MSEKPKRMKSEENARSIHGGAIEYILDFKEKLRNAFSRPHSAQICYVIALLPILLQSLNAKNTVLTQDGGGYEVIALQIGVPSDNLSLWAQYSPFISDLIVAGVFLPTLLLVVLFIIKPFWRPCVTGFVGLSLTAILFIQVKTFWEVGTFLPLSV